MARYKKNRQGLRELLRGEVAQQLVDDQLQRAEAALGDGFVGSAMQGKSRYRGIVYADSWGAKHREKRGNLMVRWLG